MEAPQGGWHPCNSHLFNVYKLIEFVCLVSVKEGRLLLENEDVAGDLDCNVKTKSRVAAFFIKL